MQKHFMLEFDLPDPLPVELIQQIPEQRDFINSMLAEGDIKSYGLAIDRSRLWMVMSAESEFEVLEMIAKMPLADWLIPVISELAFHNSSDMVLHFSLN